MRKNSKFYNFWSYLNILFINQRRTYFYVEINFRQIKYDFILNKNNSSF